MLEQLRDIICEFVEVEPENITAESRFIEDLGFNSYDFMCMIGRVEDEMDVEVQEREVAKIKTVGDAVAYLTTLQG